MYKLRCAQPDSPFEAEQIKIRILPDLDESAYGSIQIEESTSLSLN